MMLDATDRRIIEATQAGLPLAPAPYAEIGAALGLGEREVVGRMAAMLERGVYLPPSQFEACFLSLAHRDAEVEETLAAAQEALAELSSD